MNFRQTTNGSPLHDGSLALEERIEDVRQDLAETMEALGARLDPALDVAARNFEQAKREASRLSENLKDQAIDVRESAAEYAEQHPDHVRQFAMAAAAVVVLVGLVRWRRRRSEDR